MLLFEGPKQKYIKCLSFLVDMVVIEAATYLH